MGLLESIAETQELVSLPTVATKVLSMLEKDDVDIREVAKVIESDASISMKILRLANSPLFALRSQVSSINMAVLTIGLNRVTNIVLGVSIFSKFMYLSGTGVRQYVDTFWNHSTATAAVSKSIATKLKKNFGDAEFIGGLIHDIGKLGMLQHDTKLFSEMLHEAASEEEKSDDVGLEHRFFNADHIQAGELITRMWKLPDNLQAVVAHHNTPSQAKEHVGLVSVVRLADILCEQWGAGIGENVLELDITQDESWKNLCNICPELNTISSETFITELKEDYTNASSFLKAMFAD